jgi:uncharacterized protein YfdQ (DUF2303 family)
MSDTTEQTSEDSPAGGLPPFMFAPELNRPAEPELDEALQIITLPPNWTFQSVSRFFRFQARPRGVFSVTTSETLKQVIHRFADDPERAMAYVTFPQVTDIHRAGAFGGLQVILDHGKANAVGQADYKAELLLRPSGPLKKLLGFYASGGDHKALVQFLDALLLFLVYPDAAAILDSLHKISLTKETKFSRAEDLATGDVAFSFDTVTGQNSTSGRVRLPDTLEFSIPVFRGVPTTWRVKFALRYHLKDESVRFHLYHPDLDDSFENDFVPKFLEEQQEFLAPTHVLIANFTTAAGE